MNEGLQKSWRGRTGLAKVKHCKVSQKDMRNGVRQDLENTNDVVHFASAFDSESRTMTEQEFHLFKNLVHKEAGIWLTPAKTALLVGRLARRLRMHRLKSFKEYYGLVVESEEERVCMLDAISTNETHFFREPRHFAWLQRNVFPDWRARADRGGRRVIRAWSAGCSSGEEPYSLAMVLLHAFPRSTGWQIEIHATDISTRILEIAKTGIRPAEKAHEIPPEFLKAFMLKGLRDHVDEIKVGPEIRSLVSFSRVNLNEASYPLSGKFDLIFCRNVLIYFDPATRERVVHRILNHLHSDGYLFLGHAETLPTMKSALRAVFPTVYELNDRQSQTNDSREQRT